MILPIQRKIIINDQIPALEGGFGQSTIAHEIGHWLLHIEHDALDVFKERMSPELIMTIEPLICRSVTSQKGIEWQAQYFASCLLMPKFKLEEVLRGRNLTNWKHLYAIKDELGVTISNLTNRLQGLGWIDIPKGSKQIYLGNNFPR
ncbi:MAG: ImmA/IrrE family metallo-endopeptidase [Rivularia sp. ALOHA_DT_140]|nr:ImmA/IrrE family metallo-endopeptidase [Rivularia sp. ALOHA_DT_140]